MPILRTGDSEYDKELKKWDTPKSQGGYGPDGFEPFPKMLYKAFRREDKGGKVMCGDMDAVYASDPQRQVLAEAFNKQCQRTVRSQGEYEQAKNDGWCDSPADALAYHEKLQQDIAQAAAEAAYSVQRMSDKAQREYREADQASEHPTADVPAPKKAPKSTRVAVA